jgi:hypothetical protein
VPCVGVLCREDLSAAMYGGDAMRQCEDADPVQGCLAVVMSKNYKQSIEQLMGTDCGRNCNGNSATLSTTPKVAPASRGCYALPDFGMRIHELKSVAVAQSACGW